MRHSFLLFILLNNVLILAQNSPVTFEPGEFGTNWTWTTFENVDNPPLEIVDNTNPSGMNSSNKVAKFTALQAGMPYAGVECAHTIDVGTFTLNTTNCIVKIMVYKPIISNVGIKFSTASGASTGELLVPNTVINQWEELTFDFTSIIGVPSSSGIDQIIVFPDFQARSATNICYFDNITLGVQGPPLAIPMMPAPNPMFQANQVISMFSNTYTNVPVNSWQTAWSQGNLSEIQILGNDTKKYSGLNFIGIETTGNNILNVSNMTHLYMDIWTPNITEFRVKLVDFGNDLSYAGGDDSEHELSFTPIVDNWVNLDIPLSSFTNLGSTQHIAQLILSGNPTGSGVVYVDNVLFHNATSSVDELMLTNHLISPNPVQNEFSIELTEAISSVQIFALTGDLLMNQSGVNLHKVDVSMLGKGVYLCQITTTNGKIVQQKWMKE